MCGITGFYIHSSSEKWKGNLIKATDSLTQRGPDAKGTYLSSNERVGLGHRRLSILDTSSHANQPMTTKDGLYTIVFNGEIYNFNSLRTSLESKGYSFSTSSDTEVLLNLFHAYQNDCWSMLDGFFAAAIYNNETGNIVVARDRIGIKPLHFFFKENELIFGSELKSLFAFGIPKKLNLEVTQLYFRLNYIPAPYSIINDVQKLKPGHYLEYNGSNISIKSFYDLQKESDQGSSELSYEEAQKKLIQLLDDSVKNRMVSDVPLGTFLSGGLDSSVITALASKYQSGLKTFSIGFKDNKFFDETYYARLVAEKYKTDHQEFILSNDDLFESLNSFLDYVDEPFADSSAIAVNTLCKRTKEQVTVALSGDGADELFAGYNKYQGEYRIQNPSFSETIVKGFHPLWKALPKSRNSVFGNTVRKLHKFSHGSSLNKKSRYIEWCSLGSEAFVKKLLCNYSSKQDLIKGVTKLINSSNGINDILANDIELVLTNDMLTKVDLMSMANSLEVRVPFLDHKIVEFANSLPESYKINRSKKKRILQDAFRNELPNELYNRPKHGFEVPLLDWLKTDLNDRIVNDYLSIPFIKEQGIFEPLEVQKLIKKLHSSNPEDSHANVWALIVFQHWYKTVILD